jgi:HSP20 family molecular chaperone IbpA
MTQPKRNVIDLLGNFMESNDLTELFGDFFGVNSMKPNKSIRVAKNAGKVEIEIDMPGSSKSDVAIDVVESNILRVEWKTPRGEVNLKEFRIDRRADTGNIAAAVANGVLTITIPELPRPADTKKIEIK